MTMVMMLVMIETKTYGTTKRGFLIHFDVSKGKSEASLRNFWTYNNNMDFFWEKGGVSLAI